MVDDSVVVRGFLQKYLTEGEHTVLTANGGEQALQMIAGEAVDLVFLDLLMPDISGVEVLRRLAKDPDAPPVVVLSADIQASTKEEVMGLGASAFLLKPPKPADVRQAAARYARIHG